MASSDDRVGCVLGFALLLAGGFWLADNYEVRKIDKTPKPVVSTKPVRPIADMILPNGNKEFELYLISKGVKGPRTKRLAWVSRTWKKGAVRDEKTLYEVNCETGAYRTLSLIKYDKDGDVVEFIRPEQFTKTQDYASPGSFIDTIMTYACMPGFDTPAN